jgi:hypothetical protein
MSNHIFRSKIFSAEQARRVCQACWGEITASLAAGKEIWLLLTHDTRTLRQNALMWDMLTSISKQVDWHGHRLTEREWKDVLTAALKGQKSVPGIDGGFVVLGSSTSQMTVKEMSDLIDLMGAFGAEQNVEFRGDVTLHFAGLESLQAPRMDRIEKEAPSGLPPK